jgi:glycosyltransferase involved in cell wall biosynthesis
MKLSIISVNLNNANGLVRTIQSVAKQTFRDYEHIIIDGGSTDGSKEIIEQNTSLFSYSTSEKDKGIYNGMNKGIAKAKGDYCLFLNSGDWFVNEQALENFESYLDNETDIIYGNVIKINPVTKAETECKYPRHLTFNYFYSATLPHQACFVKTSLFAEIGLYDERYPIAADWAFFTLAICKFEKSYQHIDMTVSNFILDGIGSVSESWEQIKSEKKDFLDKHFNIFVKDYQEYNEIKNLQVLKFWKFFRRTGFYKLLKKQGKR